MTREIHYTASATGAAFHRCDDFVRGLMGPVGGGKSTACVMEIMRRAMQQQPGPDGLRRTRWLVVRGTYRELLDTTVRTFLQWVPATGAKPPRKWNGQAMTYRITDGDLDCEILFRALDRPDDVKKLLSLELTGAWVNEARETPKAIIDGLTSRVGRYPARMEGGPPVWFGVIMDTNPPDTDHWWYRLFEEERPERWALFKQPGGLSPQAENIENLPPAYYRNQIAGKSEDWIAVYVHAAYGFVREGKPVFPEYNDTVHASAGRLAFEPDRPLLVGLDFGLTPAAVFAQRSPRGHWRILDELIGDGIGIEAFGDQIRACLAERFAGSDGLRIWGDPAGAQRAQTDERTCFQILGAQGFTVEPSPTQNFTLRRESVAAGLNRLIDGLPGFQISPAARVLRKALGGGYAYRRVQVAGDARFHDLPDKNGYSHVADALQYLMAGGGEAALLSERRPAAGWDPIAAVRRQQRGGALGGASWMSR